MTGRLTPDQIRDIVEPLEPSSVRSDEAVRDWMVRAGFESVLDVGCGGKIKTWESIPAISWVGLDVSPFVIAAAAKLGVGLKQGSAEALPFEDNEFDVVYARHVWEHLPHYSKALKEACRVAKMGVVVVFARPPRDHTITVIRKTGDEFHNDYSLEDIVIAFQKEWADCHIEHLRLPRARQLPRGELVLFVTL